MRFEEPKWSVLIPTYNCAKWLPRALGSVLEQDRGPDLMQIEVIDDCSVDDVEMVVEAIGRGRVKFWRQQSNVGAIKNFNSCVERSRGELVHILHGDDFVLPSFYSEIELMAETHQEAALLATRSFFVDEDEVILNLTQRLRSLERPSNCCAEMFYQNNLQFASVVVRKNFYRTHGGFLEPLVHTADWEMWTRAIFFGKGVVSPRVLAAYRVFEGNDTSKLARTASNLEDLLRLSEVLQARHAEYRKGLAVRHAVNVSWRQFLQFSAQGDAAAARANLNFWRAHATPSDKVFAILRRWAATLRDQLDRILNV